MNEKTAKTHNKNPKKTPSTTSSWAKTITEVLFLLATTTLAFFISEFTTAKLISLIAGQDVLRSTIGTTVFTLFSYTLTALLTIGVMHAIGKKAKNTSLTTNRTELGLRGLPTWTDIGLAIVGIILYFLLSAILTWIFKFFPWFDIEQTQDIGFNLFLGGANKIIAFLTLTFIVPLAEELIFRGWLYGKMRNVLLAKMPDWCSMVISMLLVSTLFGFMHGQWNVGVDVFALSMVACSLREITGTIYSGTLLHITKNVIAFCVIIIV